MSGRLAGTLALARVVADRPDPTAPVTVGEIARLAGRGVSAASRACADLERHGFLERGDAYGAYRLGPAAMLLSGRAAAPLSRTVRYVLTLAAQQTGETALLASPVPTGAVVTAAVESIWTLHSSARVGELVSDDRHAVLRALGRDESGDEEGLIEATIGMSVEIASAVLAPTGHPVAVVAVRLPINRRDETVIRVRRAVVAARRTLEGALVIWLADATPPSTVAGAEPSSTLAAALRVLGALAERADTAAGVARTTGLRLDRVHRIVAECRDAGLAADADEDGLLQVSWSVHGWHRAAAIPTMVVRGGPMVAETAHRTRTCGFITVLKGMRSFTIVEELEMAGEGLRMAPWLGRAHPIVGSDGGPALAMDFTPEELTRLFPSRNSAQELKRFLERVRRTVREGVLSMEAYDDAGIVSISAPVRDAGGTVVGAACLVGTSGYMYANLAAFEQETRALAARVSAVLVPLA